MGNVAVLIGSCDRYIPCWKFVAYGFHKYWKDRPWPVYLVCNAAKNQVPAEFMPISINPDKGWGPTTIGALLYLHDLGFSTILYMMEDTWLYKQPYTDLLIRYADLLEKDKIDHIQICPTWGDCGGVISKWRAVYEPEPTLMVFANSSAYRTSLQVGFWRIKAFYDLIGAGDTPWKFEIESNKRLGDTDRYLCVRHFGSFPLATGNDPSGLWTREPVNKGKWTVTATEYIRAEGLPNDWLDERMRR